MLLQSERREKTLSVIEPPVLHRVGTTNTGRPNDQPGQDFPPPPHIQDAHRPERGGVQAAPPMPSSGPGSPTWTAGTRGGCGGGRKGRLADTADKLVFILVYFRLYPIQVVQGLLFGMGQPQANGEVFRGGIRLWDQQERD